MKILTKSGIVNSKVYTQVIDQGQPKICMRWVYTNKESNGKKTIKARLIVKSFQDKDAKIIRNDSPTCPKESLQVILRIMTSHGWIYPWTSKLYFYRPSN